MNRRLLSIFIFILTAAATSQAEVLTVGGNDGLFPNISSAIAAAHDGDRILVSPGVYTENVVIDKSLELVGVDLPRIVGTGNGSVVTITADNCIVRGLAVEHSGSDLQAEDAGILLRSSHNIIEGNQLRDILFGIYLYNSNNNLVRENTIHGRPELETGERGAGLHLWNSADNRLEANVISQTRDGMYIQSSPRNTMVGNRVSDLRYGLHFMSSDNNHFEGNVFHDNVAGAAIMYSQGIELRRNAFVHNRGFSSFGILFQDCRSCIAEENLIADNATGVFLEGVRDSIFQRNTISENDVAAQVFTSSEQNVFTQNNFIDNISPLRMIGRSKSTAWSAGEGGNYWSDYSGYDLDGDGVGDAPHKIQNIFEYLEGNYPRLRIYLNSPAAQSIVAAERSFPIIEGSNQFDPRPLMHPVKTGIGQFGLDEHGRSLFLTLFSVLALGISASVYRWGIRV